MNSYLVVYSYNVRGCLINRITIFSFVILLLLTSQSEAGSDSFEKCAKAFALLVPASEIKTRRIVLVSTSPDQPPRSAREFIANVHHQDDGYQYIMRGAAPTEVDRILVGGKTSGDGRVRGRPLYSIEDDKVKPGYVMSSGDGFSKSTPDISHKMYLDMQYYANDGSAAEEVAKSGVNIPDLRPLERFPNARGAIVVYRVPRGTNLDRHPESSAAVPSRVVAVPSNAEVIAILPAPEFIDEQTGLPDYDHSH